ncbi:MAG TPA: hypothetical protein VIY51_28370 [Xanthobacteraceae bacterium]
MSVILFILGILVTGAGIVTIGFGIPINEFNLGNTLIVSGTIAFSAGLILIGLAAAVDQLAQVVKALRPRAGMRPAPQPPAVEQAAPAAVRASPIPVQALPQAPVPPPAPAKAPVPAAPRNPIFARARGDDRGGEPATAEAEAASSSAIERLRSSLVRSDRNAPDMAEAEDAPYMPPSVPAPPATAGPALGANGAAPPGGGGGAEALKKKPPLDFLFRSKAREPEPEPFDAVWPKRGPRQAEEPNDSAGPAPSEAATVRPPPAELLPSGGEDARPTAILKSGVVDGMAYTLYVDGSIEAQLPQGTVRFGSIAELRSHIENNS